MKDSFTIPQDFKGSVLITGITGFVGSHLAEFYLNNTQATVFGITRHRSPLDHLSAVLSHPRLNLLRGDITDSSSLTEVFQRYPFDVVHHLAAQSYVPDSWAMGERTLDVNVRGTYNVLNTIAMVYKETQDYPTIHLAGSSEEYGLVYPEETPITESNPLRPMSPYGVSKIATENLGYQFSQSFNMPIIVTRGFNHSGARRGKSFVTSDFSYQVATQRHSEDISLSVGNLEAVRDFTHVLDMVQAYYLAQQYMQYESNYNFEVFNIASGVGHKVSEIIDRLEKIVGMPIIKYQVSERMRPSDVPLLLGDSTKFRGATGWKPRYDFTDIIRDVYVYWVDVLRKQGK